MVPPAQAYYHPDMTQFPPSPTRAQCIGRVSGAGSSAGANRPCRSRLRRRKAGAEAGAQARKRKRNAGLDPSAFRGSQEAPALSLAQPETPRAVASTCSAPPRRCSVAGPKETRWDRPPVF